MKQQLSTGNEEALGQLKRAINLSQGQFSLVLASCESLSLRRQVGRQLQKTLPNVVQTITVHPSITTIFTTIEAALKNRPTNALMVFGLESVVKLEDVLSATNLVREELRRNFAFPLVLWVNESILVDLRKYAPDLRNWAASPIFFEVEHNGPILFEVDKNPTLVVEVLSSYANTDFDDSTVEVVLIEPQILEELLTVVHTLRERKSVILNLTKLDGREITRAIDFLSGSICAINGSKQQISENLFLFTPSCVQIKIKVTQKYQITA